MKQPTLPIDAVRAAARDCGVADAEVRLFGGKSWKVELLSSWGWNTHTMVGKAHKARQIADLLQLRGYVCAFDVLETGGLDVIFQLA